MVKRLRVICWNDITLHETFDETFARKVAEGDPRYVSQIEDTNEPITEGAE